MPTITIHDLNPAGYSLFADNESYLLDLSSDDDLNTSGGATWTITTSSEPCVSAITAATIATYNLTRRFFDKNGFVAGLTQHK